MNCGRVLKICAAIIICVIGLASLFVMSEINGVLGFLALVGGAFCGLLLYAFGDISDNTVRIRELLEENNKKANVVNDCTSRTVSAVHKGEYLRGNTGTDKPTAINIGAAVVDEPVEKNEELVVNTNELLFRKRDCTVLIGVSAEASNKESIAIPYYVTTIESDAFANCTKLKVIDLKNVKQIGVGAFRNCPDLSEVYINRMEPGLFENVALPNGCTIHEGCPEA